MSLIKASAALALGLFALRASAGTAAASYPTCESYGVDFQSNGTYFQNISSTDDFTFVSMFEREYYQFYGKDVRADLAYRMSK